MLCQLSFFTAEMEQLEQSQRLYRLGTNFSVTIIEKSLVPNL